MEVDGPLAEDYSFPTGNPHEARVLLRLFRVRGGWFQRWEREPEGRTIVSVYELPIAALAIVVLALHRLVPRLSRGKVKRRSSIDIPRSVAFVEPGGGQFVLRRGRRILVAQVDNLPHRDTETAWIEAHQVAGLLHERTSAG